ncbi:MAG: Na+/H+ antiporter NhaC family protein [Clostridia bacterium]|nr:Na+/H+ antiporter NhaC family protein [Clostridia bacterium]
MTKQKKILIIIFCILIVALLVVAVVTGGAKSTVPCPDCDGTDPACETCGGEGSVVGSAWALLPPVIAIVLALITKEVYSSLFVGILSAVVMLADFNPVGVVDKLVSGFTDSLADIWDVGILIFLVLLGIIVSLVNKAGGSAAFGKWATKHVKTRVGAQLATFALGCLIFVDDYFNCLTVGSVMRPISDTHKVSRAKLAYLIDATAAPVCMISPISSWAAAVAGVVVGMNGIALFVQAIPYNYYSLLTIVMIIAISIMKLDYGPMKRHEQNAELGDLFTEGEKNEEPAEETSSKGKIIDLILPVAVLIVSCIIGMIYTGGFFSGENFIDAFANCDASAGLSWGALIAVIFTIVYLIIRKTVSFSDAMACIPKGFTAMVPPILILTFAWTLSGATGALGAKYFVYNAMQGVASGLQLFLPAIIFVVALALAFSTGTSWGTFGILIPIVVAVFPVGSELLIIGISACLAGAVCGDHCSPISDTTIMASAGARCNHVNHVSTQLPYALTVAGVSFVCYIIAGLIKQWYIVLPIAVVLMIGTLFVIRLFTSKKSAAQDETAQTEG